MKTKSFLLYLVSCILFLVSFPVPSALSQVPQGFNYQAVAHTSNGGPISGATIQVKMGILSDTITPVVVYEELFSTVKTNINGVFNVVIGSGVRQSGSAASFSAINWNATPLYLKIQLNYQGSWKTMGHAKLWSVPYSMVAGELASSVKKLSVAGQTSDNTEALFEVKNKTGQTVFAVYNEGVRVYVDNGVKGVKGGFAVGGFGSDKAPSQNLMTVTSDSVRIYVNEAAAKGSKGGFAVGGFDAKKGTINEFMFLTPENYFIGHSSGRLVTTGQYNSTLGYHSGKSLTTGMNNIFIGYSTGYTNTGGSSNIFIGNNAGYSNSTGNYNILLGRSSGYSNSTGWGNIIFGDYAGSSNTTGYQNVMIGDLAGVSNTEGYQNVFLGADAGYDNTTGNDNVFIGNETGSSNTSGSYNSFLGLEAGYGNTTGQYNTFMGYQAGYSSGLSSYSTSIGYKAGYSLGNWQAGTYVGFEAGLSSTGRQNVFLGAEAGRAFTTGADNVAVGASAGGSNDSPFVEATGSRNALVGYYTGYKMGTATDNVIVGAQDPFGTTHITGSYNVYLGVDAGNLSNTGSRNVFIGYNAGKNEAGNDKLYIHNNSSATPLLWGDFSLRRLQINGNTSLNSAPSPYYSLQINMDGNDSYGLVVYGPAWCSAGAWTTSDLRLKKNIVTLDNSLNRILLLRGVSFDWNKEEHPEMGFSGGRQLGLIAQEVEKVLPELVTEGPGGFKSIDYTKVTPVLIEAIKEQQKQIETYKSQLKSLQEEVAQIRTLLVKSNGN